MHGIISCSFVLKIYKIIQTVALNVHIHNAILKKMDGKNAHQFQGIAFVWEWWEGNENKAFKGIFSYISSILFLKK